MQSSVVVFLVACICIVGLTKGETYSPWIDQGTCSAKCAGGKVKQFRACLSGGCKGPLSRETDCNTQACAFEFSPWYPAGQCNASCDSTGHQLSIRVCLKGSCVGPTFTYKTCTRSCEGTWGNWAEVTSCSVTCGTGQQLVKRKCPTGLRCKGPSQQLQDCVKGDCPGEWSAWSAFSACSATCNSGFKRSTRTCTSPSNNCIGDSVDYQPCMVTACLGTWLGWKYDKCTRTCGSGTQIGRRKCSTENCGDGDATTSRSCNTQKCPGKLSPWGGWTTCSATCGQGVHSRSRACEGGNGICSGSLSETATCSFTKCSPVYGQWGAWRGCPSGSVNVLLGTVKFTNCLSAKQQRQRLCVENKCDPKKLSQVKGCSRTDCLKQQGNAYYDAFGNAVFLGKQGISLAKKAGEATFDFVGGAAEDAWNAISGLFG